MDSPMTESATLLNSHLGFLSTHVAVIHIPVSLMPIFSHALVSLVLHRKLNPTDDEDSPRRPWQFWWPFVNISVTSSECSVVCPRDEAERLFRPLITLLDHSKRTLVQISDDDYSVITIGGAGLEAGQRVLDLSTPLAMAGIPIFFFTSYWSDYILVPFRKRASVIRALEKRGFVFNPEEDGESGVMTNPASPLLEPRRHHRSSGSFDFPSAPSTPPPTTLSELQIRTFSLLRKNNITPAAQTDIKLVTCAGTKDSSARASSFEDGMLALGIVKCLTAQPAPKFFSLTLTDSESASLTLDKDLLERFPLLGEDVLLGIDSPEQVAITIDLRYLPKEMSGIVCGVASRLSDGLRGQIGRELFNMSYLSTAKGGHVIVDAGELKDAMAALRGPEIDSINGAV